MNRSNQLTSFVICLIHWNKFVAQDTYVQPSRGIFLSVILSLGHKGHKQEGKSSLSARVISC